MVIIKNQKEDRLNFNKYITKKRMRRDVSSKQTIVITYKPFTMYIMQMVKLTIAAQTKTQ